MRFIETPVFTRAILELMDDEEYGSVQHALLLRPGMGPVIQHSSGLRKIRWAVKGTGKRGGCRIIYYWDQSTETFYMLYAYRKNEQEDLTSDQIQQLARLVREEFP